MNFAMIISAVDKASAAVKAIASAQVNAYASAAKGADKAAAASAKAEKAVQSESHATIKALRQSDKIAKAAASSNARLRDVKLQGWRTETGAVERLNKVLERYARMQRSAFNRGLGAVKRGGGNIMGGAGAIGRYGVGLTAAAGAVGLTATGVATSIVGIGGEYQQLERQMRRVTRTAEATKAAMGWVQQQQLPPNSVKDLTAAYIELRNAGIDPTKGALKAAAAAAISTDQDIASATQAMASAAKGDYGGLEQFGIQAKETGKYVEYIFKSEDGRMKRLRALVKDRAAQAAALAKVIDLKFGKESAEYAKSWDGMMGRLGSTVEMVKLKIVNAGLFDFMQDKLSLLLNLIDKWAGDGTFADWADKVSRNLIFAMQVGWEVAQGLWEAGKQIVDVLQNIAACVGGWQTLAKILIALPVAAALLQMAVGLIQVVAAMGIMIKAGASLVRVFALVGGFGKIGAVLRLLLSPLALVTRAFFAFGVAVMTTPVGWIAAAVAAIAAAAYLIYDNWDSIGPYFWALWDGVKNACEAAWNWIKATLQAAWGGIVQMATDRWKVLTDFFANLWSGITDAAAAAWNGFTSTLAGLWDGAVAKASAAWDSLKSWVTGNENSATALDKHSAALRGFNGDANQTIAKLAALDAVGKNRVAFEAGGAINAASAESAKVYGDLMASARGGIFDSKFGAGVGLTKSLEAGRITLAEYQKQLQAFTKDAKFGAQAMAMLEASFKLDDLQKQSEAAQKTLDAINAVGNPDTVKQAQAVTAAPEPPKDMEAVRHAAELAKAAIGTVPPAMQGALQEAESLLARVDFTSHGVRMMQTLASGIKSGAGFAVAAVAATTQAMRDYLPHSPAKVGALSDLHRVKFSETLASSIRPGPAIAAVSRVASGMRDALSDSVGSPLSAGLAAAPAGGSGANITFAPVINMQGGDASSVKQALEDAMARFRRELPDMLARVGRDQSRRSY